MIINIIANNGPLKNLFQLIFISLKVMKILKVEIIPYFGGVKKINKNIFYIASIVFIILLIPSFLGAFAEDEGTLGSNLVWIFFAKLFNVLRFPTHTLLWSIISEAGVVIYFATLLLNCIFYGLAVERIIFYIKKLK